MVGTFMTRELRVEAYTIREVVQVSGIGRTKVFALIQSGDLDARKPGRRTLVLANSLHTFLTSLPPMSRTRA
jgi:excisionase family DNA binding protein